ncbi:MAG: tetratricopeptide repeat protein [Kiritimatiellae bacterium]|nr:tetratricopeptide repeat protein [Kiritimatiellia bacterium]
MRWWIYQFLFAVGYLLMLPHFLIRMKRRGGYRERFADRFGHYPDEIVKRLQAGRGGFVWIHAVSVGEVYVAGQMMRALREADPAIRFVLSTTSSTGWRETAKVAGPDDVTLYHPIDFIPCVRRALDTIVPRALILTESEIWPTLLLACQKRRIPVFLINARISDRSAPRYRALRFWFGPVFRTFRRIFAQSNLDRQRLIDAGADPETIQVTGSFKFDVANRQPDKERDVAAFLSSHGLTEGTRLLLGGSTWPGEDEVLVQIYQSLRTRHPDLRLALVPRHFEEADEVRQTIEEAGLACIRKSSQEELDEATRAAAARGDAVWLGDTTGELMGFYGCATVSFVGKSLCEHGAQNMIEPCLCGNATLVGPNTENFRPVMSDLLEAQAVVQVEDEEELEAAIDRLLAHDDERKALGERASEAVLRRKGAVAACATELLAELNAPGNAPVLPHPEERPQSGWWLWTVCAELLLGVQVSVWGRVLDQLAGRTYYAGLTTVLATILAFFLGALVCEWSLRRIHRPARFLAVPLLVAAFSGCLLLGGADAAMAAWQRLLVDAARSPGMYLGLLAKSAALFFLPAGALAGGIAMMTEQTYFHQTDRESGWALSLFTLTGILPFAIGCLWGAPWLLPHVGEVRLTTLLIWGFCGLALTSGILLRSVSGMFLWQQALGVLGVIAAALVLVGYPVWHKGTGSIAASGSFSRLIHRDSGFAQGSPIAVYRTAKHTVTLFSDHDYRFVYAQDGRPLLMGNRFLVPRTLTAYLPLLMRPAAKRVAVVGDEAGFYLPFYRRGGVEDLIYAHADSTCVRSAMAADAYMLDVPAGELCFPEGTAKVAKEAGYDLLVLAQEPVWMRGTARFYRPGWFARCRDAIAKEGLVALHVDTRAMTAPRFVEIAHAFSHVFPSAQFWCFGRYDWVFLGGREPITASASAMLALFEKREVYRDFVRIGIRSLTDIFPAFLTDEKGVKSFLDHFAEENSWQSAFFLPELVLGDGTARAPLKLSEVEGARQRSLAWLQQDGMDEEIYIAIRNKTDRNMDARALSVMALAEIEKPQGAAAGFAAAKDAARINPRDILLTQFLGSLELEGRRRIALSEFQGAKTCYERLLEFDPEMGLAHYGVGYCLRATGDKEAAFTHFARAVHAMPRQTAYRFELAQVAASLNDYEEAERQYEAILQLEPENAEALYRYAASLANKSRPKQEYKKAIQLAEKACTLTDWRVPEYAFGLADLYMDAGRIMDGMGLKRKLKEMGAKRTR